jgi:hypothetical protein
LAFELRWNRWTPERLAKLEGLFKAGKTYKEIGLEMNLAPSTVANKIGKIRKAQPVVQKGFPNEG